MAARPHEESSPGRRPEWTSQRAFIIASIASAVGLGNLWRFPYMVGQNEGGTFIVAYALCILAVGLPMFIIETSAGNLADRGPVGLFSRIIAKGGRWFGWSIVAMSILIMSYYFVITGWTLGYFIDSIRFDLGSFDDFTAGYASLWYFLVIAGMVFLVLRQGVSSVERLGKFVLPILSLMMVALAVYSQTLPGAAEARTFYTSFDLDLFLEPRTWQMAAGQAFYSLGVGMGILIIYGSYVPGNVNIMASATSVALANSAISLTAGLVVFSIVYTFGIPPDTGSQLSFTAFPKVFEQLAGGKFLAPAFFGLLFLAAFSSCYSSLMVAIAPLRDEFRFSGTASALIAVGATTAIGIPSALSFTSAGLSIWDKPILDWMDQLAGSGIVVFVGFAGAAIIAWRLPKINLAREMTAGSGVVGSSAFLPYMIIETVRYLPAAALVLLAITAIA